MAITQGYLSLWEIAHRWHDADPNLSDPLALPLAVQDSLRVLTHELALDNLHVVNEYGTTYWNFNDIPKREDFIPPPLLKVTNEITSEDEEKGLKHGRMILEQMSTEEAEEEGINTNEVDFDEEYQTYMDIKLRRHNEAVEDLDKCYKKRLFDKDKLEGIFLDQYEFYQYCIQKNHTPPIFWFSEKDIKAFQTHNEDEEQEERKLRPNQLNKELCRAIAQTLWSISPETTIADICRSKAIKMYGNGAPYTEKTLRSWIADLDPRSGERRGRPKKE